MNQKIRDLIEAVTSYSSVPAAGVQALVNEIADYLRSVSGEPDLVLALSRRLKDSFADISGAAEQPQPSDTADLQAQIETLTALESELAAVKAAVAPPPAAPEQPLAAAAPVQAAEAQKPA